MANGFEAQTVKQGVKVITDLATSIVNDAAQKASLRLSLSSSQRVKATLYKDVRSGGYFTSERKQIEDPNAIIDGYNATLLFYQGLLMRKNIAELEIKTTVTPRDGKFYFAFVKATIVFNPEFESLKIAIKESVEEAIKNVTQMQGISFTEEVYHHDLHFDGRTPKPY